MFTVHAYLQEEIFGIVTFPMLHFEYVPPDVIVHLPLPRCGILFTCHDFESVAVVRGNPRRVILNRTEGRDGRLPASG
jgi:hypothetical protein